MTAGWDWSEELFDRFRHGIAVYRVDGPTADDVWLVHFNQQALDNIRLTTPNYERPTHPTTYRDNCLATGMPNDGEVAAVFAAHQSGNSIFGGADYGQRHWRTEVMPLGDDHVAIIYLDISDLVIAIDQLQRAHRTAERFSYVAAHDLKEPIRAVLICCGELLEDYPEVFADANLAALVHDIERSAQRGQAIVSDLLDLSKAGQGHKPEPISSTEPLDAVLDELSHRIAESRAHIEVGEAVPVYVDPRALGRVYSNLLSNAIKFRKAGVAPQILVTARTEGNYAVIEVRDNGIGIDPKYMPRMFEAFYRIYSESEYEGTGVGLANVQLTLDAANGRVWAESDGPGLGTSIYFTLPLENHPPPSGSFRRVP